MNAQLELSNISIYLRPREAWSWNDFLAVAPTVSIALDGIVSGGPQYDEESSRVNFDHHDGVVREATMSTAMQVYFAIKGGLMDRFKHPHVFINDVDQDTALAVWLLEKHKLFTGAASVPHIGRLLALTDRLDITGGAFPMNLDDELLEEHNWVFDAYAEFRKSGALARASGEEMRQNLEVTLSRLNRFLLGDASRMPLDRRFKLVDNLAVRNTPVHLAIEEGGNTARYALYASGMQAFVARVATRPDGRFVYAVGRRSRYVDFPVQKVLRLFSAAETDDALWGGSDIIGGSDRARGSGLSFSDIRSILETL